VVSEGFDADADADADLYEGRTPLRAVTMGGCFGVVPLPLDRSDDAVVGFRYEAVVMSSSGGRLPPTMISG
jgi:hypothetical protein